MFLTVLFYLISISIKFDGTVTAVIDGDTIEVLQEGKALRIRLNGIDCPEKSQAFGSRAKQFTADLVYGKNVTIIEKGVDRYGRTIADVYVNGVWLNKALIDAGMAWHYKRYSSDSELAQAETNAREAKVGLWSDAAPTPPWDFRKNN